MNKMTLVIIVGMTAAIASGSDWDEFKVKREETFAFAKKPVVTRAGDKITIAFETKGYCDVTVAVQKKGG